MTEKLKPCPFCGNAAEIERLGDRRQSTIYACTFCGCRLETGEEWGHGTAWNTRATGWRPIEEAPKDGTVIIGWSDAVGYGFSCEWFSPHKCWYDAGRYAVAPTHFMPITLPDSEAPHD